MAHTNASIRKHLGERGYIEEKAQTTQIAKDLTVSFWRREDVVLELREFPNYGPTLYNGFYAVDPDDIGVRNVNTANDGSPDE